MVIAVGIAIELYTVFFVRYTLESAMAIELYTPSNCTLYSLYFYTLESAMVIAVGIAIELYTPSNC